MLIDPATEFCTLVRLAQDGDRPAFDRLVGKFSGPLRSWISLQLGPRLKARVEVEDILQETFIRAFRAIKQFEGAQDGLFRVWLCTISRRAIHDESRKLRSRGKSIGPVVSPSAPRLEDEEARNLASAIEDDDPSPFGRLRRDDRFERLKKALGDLPPDHRRVILLVRLQGLPVQDVAHRMGRSPQAVSMLLQRALRKLRQIFGDTDSQSLPPRDISKELGYPS